MKNTTRAHLTGGIEVTLSTPGQYIVRAATLEPLDIETARDSLTSRLLSEGEHHEHVHIRFVGDIGLDEIFRDQAMAITSLGWEGLMVPDENRRKLRIPTGYAVTPDVSQVPRSVLVGIHQFSEGVLDSPQIDLRESMVIRMNDEIVGWVPIWRLTPTTSVVRPVILDPMIHAEEERRRTHLRLSVYSLAVESQCSQGYSVLSWLPDNGDPVNALKLSVGGAANLTHWMSITVRRDLTPITPTVPTPSFS
jgi:hypothetical protein